MGDRTEACTGSLAAQIVLVPTPISQDAKHSGYAPSGPGKADKLCYAVVRLPTPQANEDAAGTPNGKMQMMLGNCEEVRGKTPEERAGGSLNPTWVEWLMGWPLGWTDCAALATDKYREWLRSHGRF
jgi:hypothetical protein